MRPIEEFCCQNIDCSDYGKRDAGNLGLHGWRGKNKDIRLLCCHRCKTRFSERKGTALYYSRLPEEKAVAVLEHVREGNGVRATSRLVGVHMGTVSRLTRVAGEHARNTHDELVAFSPEDEGSPVR